MCEDIVAAASAAAADGEVRVVLVRATGPVFCAGADLKERKEMSVDDVRNRRLRGYAAYNALEALPMPTIAVVQGAAIGSGSEIAAACDFIIATPEATFATPEALWGTVGATQRLARVLGKRLAKDLMFTGRKLTADEARTAGLVTRIIEAGALDAALADIAATIGKASATGLRQAKRCIDQGSELDPRGALAVELLAIEENLAQDSQGDTWRTRMAGFKGATSQGST
jgi:enoyl-CoA hydratase